uniref:NADH dehydrogenase subunit 4L n=1 Tax=Philagra albinotata TaxID=868271 RepID=UPI002551E13E|nr:NADH dehydrogenase subunit 4L [Philagra albinotata]WGL39479.1 NADH dehydrogenase subunit 4L [Philagra albinotata]
MNMSLFIYLYMYMIGLLTLCMIRKHIFLCLVSLEFIILSLFLMIMMYLLNFNYELYFSMIFLTFMVCEGAMGLSVLVYLIRSHGNDYLNSFSMILC